MLYLLSFDMTKLRCKTEMSRNLMLTNVNQKILLKFYLYNVDYQCIEFATNCYTIVTLYDM